MSNRKMHGDMRTCTYCREAPAQPHFSVIENDEVLCFCSAHHRDTYLALSKGMSGGGVHLDKKKGNNPKK